MFRSNGIGVDSFYVAKAGCFSYALVQRWVNKLAPCKITTLQPVNKNFGCCEVGRKRNIMTITMSPNDIKAFELMIIMGGR